jgi:acyl transferase domain-containing protein
MSVRTVFMFSGQGSQYFQMARGLFREHAEFRDSMLAMDRIATQLLGRSVIAALYDDVRAKSDEFAQLTLTHPALFMVQRALAKIVMNAGVAPDCVLGVSLGSYVAAVIAGVLTEEDALAAVIRQAQWVEACCEPGGMLAVLAPPALYEEHAALHRHTEIAGVNFATHFVLSGRHAHVNEAEKFLNGVGVMSQRLAVRYAFHSRSMDGVGRASDGLGRKIEPRAPAIPIVSCARVEFVEAPDEVFFWEAVRMPMRFQHTIERLARSEYRRYVDLGPSGTLATFVSHLLPPRDALATAILSPYAKDEPSLRRFLATSVSA